MIEAIFSLIVESVITLICSIADLYTQTVAFQPVEPIDSR